ncbi:MAG: SGNH/GDSL hydrolase family protein [Acidobacteriaceae bacterium]|nr:SGNH/GDSL hydrolase family protein [Acidobacteriaceae bacterium]
MKLFALTGVLLCLPGYVVVAGTINQLVVFGDSLSDNGNAAAALASQGKTFGNYAANAVTDGPNTMPSTRGPFGLWVDQFSTKFGLADPKPFVVDTPTGLAINPAATNFAVADALTGHNPNFNQQNFTSTMAIPGTTDQVAIYNTLNHNTASASALYSFWAGANDIIQALTTNPLNIIGDSISAADNIESDIKTLAGEGAKNFLWFNMPPLGDTPRAQSAGPLVVAAANAAALAFNAEMTGDVASLTRSLGIDLVDIDTHSLVSDMIANPAKYEFTNVTDAAQGLNVNPNEYLFWDGIHPTTQADAFIAQLVETDISGRFTAAPEPSSLLFAGFGLLTLCAGMRFRRAKN